jgi:hypothetical protein
VVRCLPADAGRPAAETGNDQVGTFGGHLLTFAGGAGCDPLETSEVSCQDERRP